MSPASASSLGWRRLRLRAGALALAAGLAFGAATRVRAGGSEIERRGEAMLGRLTLEQKIGLLGGEDVFFTRAIPEIGLPRLRMSDGPMGVRTWGPSTAYAGGAALAATWDRDLAERVGVSLGRDARARGVSFLLGPGVNIYRAPVNGRNFEYFGEDPYLSARLAVSYIQGVQSQGVVATVKHYAANNSEYDRVNANSIVDERTLREIYLPAFEAAVKEGHVGAVMNSYNLLNGEHTTQNAGLNLGILKHEWGFDGILMSDWGAAHDGAAAANAGLDLEMPDAGAMSRQTLLAAVASGRVSVATIDDKVRRILRVALEFELFERGRDRPTPLYDPRSRQVALETAQESVVLLKNDRNLLPFDSTRIHSLALLGPNAHPAVVGGGGSSLVTPFSASSLLTGLGDFVGDSGRVDFSPGIKSPQEIFGTTRWSLDPAGRQAGLMQEEYDTAGFTGAHRDLRADRLASWIPDPNRPPLKAAKAERFSGYFVPPKTGTYIFVAAGNDGDAFRLTVDGRLLLERTPSDTKPPQSAELALTQGRPMAIAFDYHPATAHLTAGLGVVACDEVVLPEAKTLAAAADAVIVSVGFDAKAEGEGFDRTYQLPFGHDELIAAALASNPRTLVVLNAGGGVDTRAWITAAPAVLDAFYGGQESGRALAQIIFGRTNPAGHLPFSFEKAIEDNPSYPYYYPAAGTRDVPYHEGIFTGYRFYDRAAVKPLFPFGFGLSYTTFHFSHLAVDPASTSAGRPVTVRFEVQNTGRRSGAEIVQLYVGDPSARVERPLRELKGFRRVFLNPGEIQPVSMTLDRRAFAYWSVALHDWRIDPGLFTVHVGDSSVNLPLQAAVTIR